MLVTLKKLSLIEDRGRTDHVMDSAPAAGLGRAMPHASPRQREADDVAIKRTMAAVS